MNRTRCGHDASPVAEPAVMVGSAAVCPRHPALFRRVLGRGGYGPRSPGGAMHAAPLRSPTRGAALDVRPPVLLTQADRREQDDGEHRLGLGLLLARQAAVPAVGAHAGQDCARFSSRNAPWNEFRVQVRDRIIDSPASEDDRGTRGARTSTHASTLRRPCLTPSCEDSVAPRPSARGSELSAALCVVVVPVG